MAAPKTGADARAVINTRLIDAPRELVFAAFTQLEHLQQWWGPNGFTTTTSRFELRPGGVWRFVMHGPDGTDYQNRIIFDEITPPERILYRHDGGDDVEGVRFRTTLTFEDVGGATRVTLRGEFETQEERDRVVEQYGADEGGQQTLGRLAALAEEQALAGRAEAFEITRWYDAPRALLWTMLSEERHLARWWGPAGFAWLGATLEFRPGGRFHYAMRAPDGQSVMWGLFQYRDIAAPSRIVFVNSFSNEAGEIAAAPFAMDWPLEVLNVITLSEERGGTQLNLRGAPVNATAAQRAVYKGHHASMQQGFGASLAALETYLSEAQSQA